MSNRKPPYSPEQVAELARLVEDELAKLSRKDLRILKLEDYQPAEYRDDRHSMPFSEHDISVPIDFRNTVLTFAQQHARFGRPKSDEDVAGLAARICQEVALVVRDRHVLAKLRRIEKEVISKLTGLASKVILRSVRYRITESDESNPRWVREVWVELDILDDYLKPQILSLCRYGPRSLNSKLTKVSAQQLQRLMTLERLKMTGGILEIETTVEHALKAAGLKVGSIAKEIMQTHHPICYIDYEQVWGTFLEETVYITIRNGRMTLESDEETLYLRDRTIRLPYVFPETVIASLVGRPLRTLIDHPLLDPEVKIIEAMTSGTTHTVVTLASVTRPLFEEELSEPEPYSMRLL